MMRSARVGLASIVVVGALSACKPVDTLLDFFGIERPQKSTLHGDLKNEIKSAEADPGKEKKTDELAKENQELLGEVVRVVFNQDSTAGQGDFDALVHTLNQGASLEGIYRGLVMGSRYRGLESKGQGATPEELRVFATEMAQLQMTMRKPTHFDMDSKNVPQIEFPDEASANATPVSNPSPNRSEDGDVKKDKAALEQELLRKFIGASHFALKRILGEEALRKFEESKNDPSEIAQWYASLVLRLIDRGVDGGLELRNKPDFQFHLKFAEKMALDRVKWEVLNRYHRYLNAVSAHSQ